MKIWAISDIHLPGEIKRTMEFFGNVWNDHPGKIVENWRRIVGTDDIVLIGGDISWSYKLEGAMRDLNRLASLPGHSKVIIKGNHDIWWKTYQLTKNALPNSLIALEGNTVKINDQVICGTRGWLAPNDPCFDQLDMNTFQKELKLLKRSLDEAVSLNPVLGIHVLMHFPPFTTIGLKTKFFELLKEYPIQSCIYGHFHLKKEWRKIPNGMIDGISCQLTSSDYLNHKPILIWDSAVVVS